MPNNSLADEDTEDDRPPVLGSWRTLYAIVLILHLALIVAFYAFSQSYTL